MSRPFSYNDENFNVIGNVLFVYFKYKDRAPVKTRLIEIPPAVCDRLMFFFSIMGCSVYNNKNSAAADVSLTVVDYNNKCYLANNWELPAANADRYIFAIFPLKNI